MSNGMNQEVKRKIRMAGIYQWQVAKALGVSEVTLVRWLRDELSDQRRNAIDKAIEEAAKEYNE